jgi:hypothetical protein
MSDYSAAEPLLSGNEDDEIKFQEPSVRPSVKFAADGGGGDDGGAGEPLMARSRGQSLWAKVRGPLLAQLTKKKLSRTMYVTSTMRGSNNPRRTHVG